MVHSTIWFRVFLLVWAGNTFINTRPRGRAYCKGRMGRIGVVRAMNESPTGLSCHV